MDADKIFRVQVECYAGYRGDETPRRFFFGSRQVEVVSVLDRWLGEDHRYFKVGGDDGNVYILRHDERADAWEMLLFDRRQQSKAPESGQAGEERDCSEH